MIDRSTVSGDGSLLSACPNKFFGCVDAVTDNKSSVLGRCTYPTTHDDDNGITAAAEV